MRERVRAARVARLATTDTDGRPHLVPIVFVLDGERLYSAVDAKPKRSRRLRRVANARERPDVTVLKYEQYRREPPGRPVLAVDILEWRSWDASATG